MNNKATLKPGSLLLINNEHLLTLVRYRGKDCDPYQQYSSAGKKNYPRLSRFEILFLVSMEEHQSELLLDCLYNGDPVTISLKIPYSFTRKQNSRVFSKNTITTKVVNDAFHVINIPKRKNIKKLDTVDEWITNYCKAAGHIFISRKSFYARNGDSLDIDKSFHEKRNWPRKEKWVRSGDVVFGLSLRREPASRKLVFDFLHNNNHKWIDIDEKSNRKSSKFYQYFSLIEKNCDQSKYVLSLNHSDYYYG